MANTLISGKPKPSQHDVDVNYAAKKELDLTLDKLFKTNLNSCRGDLWKYNETLEKLFDQLTPALEDPATLKQALFRRGLPQDLQSHAAFYQAYPDKPSTDAKVNQVDLIDALYRLMVVDDDEDGADKKATDTAQPTQASEPDLETKADETTALGPPGPKRKRPKVGEASSTKPKRAKKQKQANAAEKPSRTNAKKLAAGNDQPITDVKAEQGGGNEDIDVYHLGPSMPTNMAWPYLLDFGNTQRMAGRLEMDVANKPQLSVMTTITAETVANYARARTNRLLEGLPHDNDDEAIEIVNLETEISKEPTAMTRAGNFQASLDHITKLCRTWKKSASLAVHQKIIESWAINVLFQSIGLQVGDAIPRPIQSVLKAYTKQLLPILRPSRLQGASDQSLLRTQYYRTLLAKFRTSGAAFIFAYCRANVDSIFLLDSNNRSKANETPPWSTTMASVQDHVVGWFDALEGAQSRPELQGLVNEIHAPCSWAMSLEQAS